MHLNRTNEIQKKTFVIRDPLLQEPKHVLAAELKCKRTTNEMQKLTLVLNKFKIQ